MFVICANVEGNGALVNDEWKTIRVNLDFNTYFRCELKLKQVTMYSQVTLPSLYQLPSMVELRWKNHAEVLRYYVTYNDSFLPTRVIQLKSCEMVNMWLAEVYSQGKQVEVEYRLLGSGGSVLHPDTLQFVFEADV
jgi:hypothetical protein